MPLPMIVLLLVIPSGSASVFAVVCSLLPPPTTSEGHGEGHVFTRAVTSPPRPASTLPKAGVQPEGRNDPSIAPVLALAVARPRCNHQKPQQKPVSSTKPPNSMQTNDIEFAE